MPATQRVTNYDVSQVFLGNNFYKDFTYTNSTGSSVDLAVGRLVGQILASAKILPNISSATDGSELPMGVLAEAATVANGATATLSVCIAGRVNQNTLTLGAGDTLDTAVRTVSTGGGTLGALITRNTNIELVPSTEVTITDPNQ